MLTQYNHNHDDTLAASNLVGVDLLGLTRRQKSDPRREKNRLQSILRVTKKQFGSLYLRRRRMLLYPCRSPTAGGTLWM